MKRKRFSLLVLVALLALTNLNNTFGQSVGDYGSTAASGTAGTMNWFTGTWYICNSAGTWAGATSTTTPPTQNNNVWILSGDSVTISFGTAGTLAKCKNLEVAGKLNQVGTQVENSQIFGDLHVASTGIFYGRQKLIWGNWLATTSNLTIDAGGKFLLFDQFRLYGSSTGSSIMTNNGIFGQSTVVAGSSATIYMINASSASGNADVRFTGTGKTIFRRLFADTNAGSFNITVDQDMTFCPASTDPGIKLQNASGATSTSTRTFTINAGKTVTISGGWFANNAAFTGADANNTYTINGTLDASAASIYFGCTSNTSYTTNSQIINIGATGTLKCGSTVYMNKPQAGQTLAVNVEKGGTITYKGSAFQTKPTASTYTVATAPSALLCATNSKLAFTNSSATTIAVNSALIADSLGLAAPTTLTGAGNTTVNNALTLGGVLVNNAGNLALGTNAGLNGSSTNYIDLAAGGSFTRNGVLPASTLIPVGNGSYYTPLTLANTTGNPNITVKVKTSLDNAVEDATKIVNLQWSILSSIPTTSDIKFQFNGANKASAFDAASTCDLGVYSNSWAAVNLGTPVGTDPYSIAVYSLTIPTTENFYVIGNTGKVARMASTSSTWTGSVNTDWATAGNWSNGVPDNTFDAIIPASLTSYPVLTGTQAIKNLTVESGASITNNGTLLMAGPSLTVNGTLSGNGVYQFNGSVAQTINGVFAVNNLTVNNTAGVINNGTLILQTKLNLVAGGLSGTAPVYPTDMPVEFTGSGTSSTGLFLSPSAGTVGTLTLNGTGTLSLSNPVQIKTLTLTAGTLDNSAKNLTVSTSLNRTAGVLLASPNYGGSIPVTYNGTIPTYSGSELTPASGSINTLTISGSDVYTVSNTFNTTGNIHVVSGTFKMGANVAVQNVMVEAAAVFNSDNTATSAARHTLTIGNGAAGNDAILTVNGTMGNTVKWTNDGIDIEISGNAKTLTINGTGFIGISGMRPAADANTREQDVFIDNNLYLDRDNGGASNIESTLTLQNGTCTFARTLTIAAGDTVFFRGNGALHGAKNTSSSTDELINNYASTNVNQGNCTYYVYGMLDFVSAGYTASTALNLNTTSFTGNAQSVILNVKAGGVVKLPGIVKMFTALSGQTADIVAEPNSTVIFGFNGTQYNVLTGTGKIPEFNFQNVVVNNANGMNLTKPITIKGSLTLTAGNITGSAVVMNGTEAQTIVANGNAIANLTINNAAGVTGAPVVTNTLSLTNGTISDFSNLANATVVFNGSVAQTIGEGLSSVKNLTINNTAGVSLGSAPTVSGVLAIQSGKLSLGNYNLTIGTSGSISLASSDNYVVTDGAGLLVMNAPVSTSTVFPIGTSATFNPVTLNPASTSTFYVGVKNAIAPALPLADATILPLKSVNRTWSISTSTPSATTLTFGYNGGTDANAEFDNSGTEVALLQNDGSNWKYVGFGAVVPGIGITTAKTATVEGIGSFAAFTLANPGPGAIYNNTSGNTFSDVFRSTGNGNWNSATLWELKNADSDTWAATVLSPTATSTVTIQSGDTVMINTQAGVGNLTIESAAVLKSTVSAYTSTPIVLALGKASSVIRNNGLFGCPINSPAGTSGDGITLAMGANCVSFLLTGTGESGIGNMYALASSNNLSAVIDQNTQFRYSTAGSKRTALTLLDPNGAAFTGSRYLLASAGKSISFLNSNSCLHGTTFSTEGSYAEQQGNITYNFQGGLDLKGGNVYITSSKNVLDSAQVIKLNVGKNANLVVAGDFNFCKVQAKQAVYVYLEDSAFLDATMASVYGTNVYGPSTNSTAGYGSNYVWVITNGSAKYARNVGNYGSKAKYFNVAVAPKNGDYAGLTGNPLWITNNLTEEEVYTVNVNPSQPYPFTTFSADYALNRTWMVKPTKMDPPCGSTVYYGFTGTPSTDGNASFSPTQAAASGSASTYTTGGGPSIPAGASDILAFVGLADSWCNVAPASNIIPAVGTFGTPWQLNFFIGNYFEPYLFTLRNKVAPQICH
jgi:hypothetical protein